MRLIILLGCAWLVSANTVPDKCNGVRFNGAYYDKEVLRSEGRTYDALTYQKSTETLFLSYNLPAERNDKDEYFITASFNLITKEFHDIYVPGGGFTTTVDPATQDIYLGSLKNGIYKYNTKTKAPELLAAKDIGVLFLYFDKGLYYITAEDYILYSANGTESKLLSKKDRKPITRLIGDNDAFFYINKEYTQLYRKLTEGSSEEVYTPSGNYRGFAKDANGNIFVFGSDGIYVPNRKEKRVDKVAEIDNVYGLTFDKENNVIYSDAFTLVKLTPGDPKCLN